MSWIYLELEGHEKIGWAKSELRYEQQEGEGCDVCLGCVNDAINEFLLGGIRK